MIEFSWDLRRAFGPERSICPGIFGGMLTSKIGGFSHGSGLWRCCLASGLLTNIYNTTRTEGQDSGVEVF